MTNANTKLSTRAVDYRLPVLSRPELETLWADANAALHTGRLGAAFAAVEGLLVQAKRGTRCPDLLPNPAAIPAMARYGVEMLQGLVGAG